MPPRKTKDSVASPKKEKATKAKKEKKQKDPNAPKKPSGAYIFFCNDKRAEVKKANPEFGVAESGRELGSMWKSATDDDKKVGAGPLVLVFGHRVQATRSLSRAKSYALSFVAEILHTSREGQGEVFQGACSVSLCSCQDLVSKCVLCCYLLVSCPIANLVFASCSSFAAAAVTPRSKTVRKRMRTQRRK